MPHARFPGVTVGIIAINALFRPGPIQSGMLDDFAKRTRTLLGVLVVGRCTLLWLCQAGVQFFQNSGL